MSHMLALAIIGPDGDPTTEVERLMAPYREEWDEQTQEYSGWWDWYQIGGRWTGLLTDYDPTQDPANMETCELCHGTGTRLDAISPNGCNGCGGLGWCISWPTDWEAHPRDVMPAEQAARVLDLRCWTLVTPDGFEHKPNEWQATDEDDEKWRAYVRGALSRIPGARVVVVDYHN